MSPHRRRLLPHLLLALAALLSGLILAACGGGSDDEATTTKGTAAPGATDAFPAKVTHKYGTTTVPKAPERVVAVGYNDQDFALALGVVPVGARQFQAGIDITRRPWAQASLKGARPELVGAEELNLERIASLRPDLILGIYSGMTKDEYDRLSQIAPTVAQTADHVDFGVPWPEQARATGQALGRTARAKEVVADVEADLAEAKGVEDFSDRTLVLASGGKEFSAFASADLRTRLFTSLGFTTPKAIDDLAGKQFYASISQERLDLLDADVLVIYGKQAELERQPAFAALDVVKEGRVVYLDESGDLANALGFSSPLSIPYAVERFLPQLRAAADGDPATKVPAAAAR
ncbi:iron-siderophore ABC transporter substrate-binding protein [Patulibacter americanus]|uniref:iron-siderophore ABC transporter substrate-binding protein n=1 Tax=Patulibacter americanus TaxID=588672 RepID=UPI0003B67A7B|nr:iron-siderophore ABC transporter substrate-binding protein [Patulibacter americanus]